MQFIINELDKHIIHISNWINLIDEKFKIFKTVHYNNQSYTINNTIREKSFEIIKEILLEHNDPKKDSLNEAIQISNKIEQGIYDSSLKELHLKSINCWTEHFLNIYNENFIRIVENLDLNSDVKNTYLLDAIMNKKIEPYNLAFMATADLYPLKNIDIQIQIEERMNQKIEAKTSTMYRCPKCHKNETTYQMKQLRSGDEGMNALIQCINCKWKWVE